MGRLAAVLSLRTISGKLIVGLVVLFGLASIIVSVVTAQSLNNSLMSSLNQQLWPRLTPGRLRQQSGHDGQGNEPTITTPSRLIPTTTRLQRDGPGPRHVRGGADRDVH